MEKDNLIKMSFRSKGNFDVNTIARTYFNGGGHLNAAGGRLECTMDEAVAKFEEILVKYSDDLRNHTF